MLRRASWQSARATIRLTAGQRLLIPTCTTFQRSSSTSTRNDDYRELTVSVWPKVNQPEQPVFTVAVLSETYAPWERRTPLTPTHIHQLVQLYHDKHGTEQGQARIQVLVQPSARRIFPDQAYAEAGAIIQNDVSAADVILGVKRPADADSMLPDKTYVFFSHTVKGQAENMELLQQVMAKRIQLMDYECLLQKPKTAEHSTAAVDPLLSPQPFTTVATEKPPQLKPKRLVSFGRFAGMAGMVDTFHAVGRRLLYRDECSTPFLSCPVSVMHDTLEQAKDRVLYMGERIAYEGLPESQEPLVFSVTGKGGSVHEGVLEILQLLPHEQVSVADLPEVMAQGAGRQNQVYICPVGIPDAFERLSGYASFDRQDFNNNPGDYRSVFADRVAPYTQVIMNCVYWDARYPRLLTKRQMRRLVENGNDRLMMVSDISCDVHGSIEFLDRTTTIERPFFTYDPITGREVSDEIGDGGITVMGVDILPTEFPRESSEHFGDAVVGVVKELAEAKQQQTPGPGVDTQFLAPNLVDACITTVDGKLAHGFRYLDALVKRAPRKFLGSGASMVISLDGHLFDSGLINQILDVVEMNECGADFRQCRIPPNKAKSSVLLQVTSNDKDVLDRVESKIASLVEVIEKAEASMKRVDHGRAASTASMSSGARVEGMKQEKKVLLLGAGRVSKSLVQLLGRSGDYVITVVADNERDARAVAKATKKGRHVALDIMNDPHRLSDLIEESDMVISLLPAPMHPQVASECIVHKKDFVTASYESDEIRSMNERAKAAGIIMLNEVGLDPGLDHMSAMKIIDDIKSRGGKVTCFSSVCGGLPAPEAADNPLKYKFSWSPKGVISASQNSARYRWEGRVMEIHGNELLQSAAPFLDNWSNLNLECLPNRDSIKYEQIYSIEGAETIFRGTLRYRGFCSLMNVFRNMGLFDSRLVEGETWEDVIDMLRKRRGGFRSVSDFVEACAEDDSDESRRAIATLDWLGMLGREPVSSSSSVVDAFCDVLESKLQYQEHERDMVAMHHTIEASFEDGSEERHYSSLQVFGDEKMTAMAKTVGFPAAIAADLILSGSLRGEQGLLLPMEKKVYAPILEAVDREGISFEESVSVQSPLIQQDVKT